MDGLVQDLQSHPCALHIRLSGLHPEADAVVFDADNDGVGFAGDGDGELFFAFLPSEAVLDGILNRYLDHHRRKFDQLRVDLRVYPDVCLQVGAEAPLFEVEICPDEIYFFGQGDAQLFRQAEVETHDLDQVIQFLVVAVRFLVMADHPVERVEDEMWGDPVTDVLHPEADDLISRLGQQQSPLLLLVEINKDGYDAQQQAGEEPDVGAQFERLHVALLLLDVELLPDQRRVLLVAEFRFGDTHADTIVADRVVDLDIFFQKLVSLPEVAGLFIITLLVFFADADEGRFHLQVVGQAVE